VKAELPVSRRPTIVCDCGAELPRPVPSSCPTCGARIVAIRRRQRGLLPAVIGVLALFAVLAAFVWWLASG